MENTVTVEKEYKAQLGKTQKVREREDKLKRYVLLWEYLEHCGSIIII